MATPYDMRPRVDPSAISKPQQAGLPGQPPGQAGPQQGPSAPQTQAQSPGQPPQGGMAQAAGQSRFAGATAQSAAPRNSAPIQPQPMPASTQPSAHGSGYWDRSAGHIRNTGGGSAMSYAKAVAPGQVPTTLPYGLSNQIGWANAVAGQHVNFAEPEVAAAPDGIPEGTPDGQVPPSNGSKGNAPQGKKTGTATGSTGQGLDSGQGGQPDNGSGGVVLASASAEEQGPPQTGSTVKLETGGGGADTIPGVANAQQIDLDGVRGWYDPQTGTTYRDNGDGTASVVVDKNGYGEDGRPFTGDAFKHPVPNATGPNGETVGQNSVNNTYWYRDKNTNAVVQCNEEGDPIDGQGGVQTDAEGNPIQGGGKTQDEKDWQSSIEKLLGEQAPQMSDGDIQGSIDADRKRQAYEQSQAIALQMGLSGNMSAEQFGSNIGRTATEFGTQGAQREAATRLQLKMQNIQAQMTQYQNKVQTLRDMAARADSKENRDYAFAAAATVESRQMAMQMEYAKFQRELNKMSFGEGLLSVFSGILGGAANAGISRLIGGK